MRKEQATQIPGGEATPAEGTRPKALRQDCAWNLQSNEVSSVAGGD